MLYGLRTKESIDVSTKVDLRDDEGEGSGGEGDGGDAEEEREVFGFSCCPMGA
jgi:hypothetical protein